MALTAIVAYIGCALWTLRVSFTSSRTFASSEYIGFAQYERLFDNERWVLSLHNLALYGVLFIVACLVIGCLLAVFIDQNVTGEGVLRTVFLYPYAMSFVATGLVWQWMLTPGDAVAFDWIIDQDMAQGIGYTVASLGPLAVGVVHEVTGGWNAVGWIFAVIGLCAIVAGGGQRRSVTGWCDGRLQQVRPEHAPRDLRYERQLLPGRLRHVAG